MARKPRVHFPGALYHVIVRGNKGQRVFRREADFKLYLRLLGEYKEVFDFVLCAYALMPTHVHLLWSKRGTSLFRALCSGFSFGTRGITTFDTGPGDIFSKDDTKRFFVKKIHI